MLPNPPIYPRMMTPNPLNASYNHIPTYEVPATNSSNGAMRPTVANSLITNATEPSTSLEMPSTSNSPIPQAEKLSFKNALVTETPVKLEAGSYFRNHESIDSEYTFPKGINTRYPSPVASKLSDKDDSSENQPSKPNVLYQMLWKEFPNIKKATLAKYVAKVRAKHNNRLTGMLLTAIVQEVRNAIFEDHVSKGAIPKDSTSRLLESLSKPNSMGLDKFTEVPFTWGVKQQLMGEPKQYTGDEDECYICLADMDISDLHSLSCGHAYHKECIMRWFEVDNTCPTCRLYAPLEDEFPKLN